MTLWCLLFDPDRTTHQPNKGFQLRKVTGWHPHTYCKIPYPQTVHNFHLYTLIQHHKHANNSSAFPSLRIITSFHTRKQFYHIPSLYAAFRHPKLVSSFKWPVLTISISMQSYRVTFALYDNLKSSCCDHWKMIFLIISILGFLKEEGVKPHANFTQKACIFPNPYCPPIIERDATH